MSNFSLEQAKKNALLQMAGKQLGTDPNSLKEKLESGQVNEIVDGLSQEQKEKVNAYLQNPQALNALLGSAQVQNLLKALGGQGKG